MKSANLLFLLLTICWLAAGCGSSRKIEALKPEPDNAAPLEYDNEISYLNMPVSVPLKDVENKINTTLTGLIYEDQNIEDDDIAVKIWKQAPIQLDNVDGKIRSLLPLKAQVKYRIGTNKLGVDLYTTREFLFDGNISLLSQVRFSNWKLTTITEFKSLTWNESPSITVMGKAIPITYVINPALRFFKEKMEKSIDNAIEKSMDFKPNVLDALEKICTPFLMNESYSSWLTVNPSDLYATDATFRGQTIVFDLGLKCTMETRIGQKPANPFNRNKINLKAVSSIPQQIAANIVAVSTYEDASKIMTRNFTGQEFGSGSKKIKVQTVNLWHKEGKMIIALAVLGSVEGTLYLSGIPQYSEATKEIYFDQLDFVLDTKSTLIRTASWLAQGYILKKFEESCRYSIAPNIEEGKASMQKYLKNYAPMPGVFVNGTLKDIQFKKVQLTNKAVVAFVKVIGDVDISIDGIK